MANEQIEEITPSIGGNNAAKAGNPMIPVMIVLVLMPAVSFGLTKFIFIPQIQTAVTESVLKAGGANASMGDHGATATEGMASDASAGAHGAENSHGEAGSNGAPPGPTGNTYEFEGIIANLSGSSMNRYVRVSFVVEGSGNDFAGIVDANRVKLIDATITVLSSLTSLDLQNPGIKNHVRSKLMAAYDAVLNKRLVEGLYFSEFVVQ